VVLACHNRPTKDKVTLSFVRLLYEPISGSPWHLVSTVGGGSAFVAPEGLGAGGLSPGHLRVSPFLQGVTAKGHGGFGPAVYATVGRAAAVGGVATRYMEGGAQLVFQGRGTPATDSGRTSGDGQPKPTVELCRQSAALSRDRSGWAGRGAKVDPRVAHAPLPVDNEASGSHVGGPVCPLAGGPEGRSEHPERGGMSNPRFPVRLGNPTTGGSGDATASSERVGVPGAGDTRTTVGGFPPVHAGAGG
jgi:hypothetical protein